MSNARDNEGRRFYPLAVTLPYTAFVAVLVPVYWREYGPGNFLWFSDIALFAVLVVLWTGWRLPYSMMAVGVLPFEVAWTVDFLAGGALMGLAAYMFDPAGPTYLRALSLFHLALPPLIVWMLVRQGYDRRGALAQTPFAWAVLLASWALAPEADNINWVHGLGAEAWQPLPPLLYLGLYMALLPVVVILPMHALLSRLVGDRDTGPQRPTGADRWRSR